MTKPILTAERARALLSYDPLTGELRWKIATSRKIKVGSLAGSDFTAKDGKSYRQIGIDKKMYKCHRVIWLIEIGEWPEYEVDHKDGNGLNNKWTNLRDFTRLENAQNRVRATRTSKSGVLGVSFRGEKAIAQITINNKTIYLGTFDTVGEAQEAYQEAKRIYHETFKG